MKFYLSVFTFILATSLFNMSFADESEINEFLSNKKNKEAFDAAVKTGRLK